MVDLLIRILRQWTPVFPFVGNNIIIIGKGGIKKM